MQILTQVTENSGNPDKYNPVVLPDKTKQNETKIYFSCEKASPDAI